MQGGGSDDDDSGDGDILSSLSESIIHHIFSFLETTDAVRMSAVPRKWRYFWRSMPYLSFNGRLQQSWSPEKFKDFINWVLMSRSRSVDIQRFRMFCLIFEDDYTLFYKWMDVVTEKNLQELDLSVHLLVEIEFLQYILNCGSLVSLKLSVTGCVLKLHTFPGFKRLKSLELRQIKFLESGLVGNLVSSCPILENLTINSCTFRDLKILDITAPRSKNLTLDLRGLENYQLKVVCPNLMSLTVITLSSMDLLFEEMNFLQDFFMEYWCTRSNNVKVEQCCRVMSNILKGICNVKALRVPVNFLKFLRLAVDNSLFFSASFNNLKSLTLVIDVPYFYYGKSLVNLLDWSPNLEALTISYDDTPTTLKHFENCYDHWNIPNKTISCLKYHLKTIEIVHLVGNKYELDLVKFLLKNGNVLEKMRIRWDSYFWNTCRNKDKIIPKVMKFPRSSPNVALTFVKPKHREYHMYDKYLEY